MKEIIYTILGAAGMKLIDYLFLKGKFTLDEASAIRRELKEEVTNLRSEITTLENQLINWKNKYYELKDQYIDLKAKYDELALHYDDLQADLNKTKQEIVPELA